MSDKKKNITFIIASLEGFGGTNRVATLLANGLSSYHDITILSRYSIKNTYPLNSEVKDIKFTGNNLFFVWQCKKYINDKNPDVVVIHTMSKLTPAILGVRIKTEVIWSLEHISFDFHNQIFKYLRRKLYKKLDKVVTLTHEDAKNYTFIADKVSVIANSNPLPIRQSFDNLNSKIVVSIGRLTTQKGYDLLIKAWSLVNKKHPDWSLYIYGEGEDKTKLEGLITRSNLQNITLKGITNNVKSIYDAAAFYVMSSRFEGFGMVLIEAQSRGLPIVSFDCPSGPAEIVHHGIDGILVENGNVSALTNAMIDMIESPHLRKEMAVEALQSAQTYHIDKVVEEWLKLLANA